MNHHSSPDEDCKKFMETMKARVLLLQKIYLMDKFGLVIQLNT